MATVNRFNKFLPRQFNSQYFVPEVFTPNFELLAKGLQAQQGRLDSAKMLADLPVQGLPGEDTLLADELRKKQYEDIDNVVDLYQKKGIQAGNKELSNLSRSIRRSHLPGGDAYAIKTRLTNFQEFVKAEKVRLSEGKLWQAQFWASTADRLAEYNKAGGFAKDAVLNLTPRTEKVDRHKLFNEYITKYHPDLIESEHPWREDGRLLLTKKGEKFIAREEVQRDLEELYRSAAAKTGELQDLFKYRTQGEDFTIDPFVTESNNFINEVRGILGKITLGKKATEEEIRAAQEELNAIGYKLAEDGILGKGTQRAIDTEKKAGLEALQNAEASLKALETADPRDLAFSKFAEEEIRSAVNPYASKAAHMEKTIKTTGHGIGLAGIRYKHQLDNKAEERETQFGIPLGNPYMGENFFPDVKVTDGGLKLEDPQGVLRKAVDWLGILINAPLLTPRELSEDLREYAEERGSIEAGRTRGNELLDNIKKTAKEKGWKNNDGTPWGDHQIKEYYDNVRTSVKNISPLYSAYTTKKSASESKYYGGHTVGQPGALADVPAIILSSSGSTGKIAGAKAVSKIQPGSLQILGEIEANSQIPDVVSGKYGVAIDAKTKEPVVVIISPTSVEEDMRAVHVKNAAEPSASLKEKAYESNGQKFISVPDLHKDGTVTAIVYPLDADGNKILESGVDARAIHEAYKKSQNK